MKTMINMFNLNIFLIFLIINIKSTTITDKKLNKQKTNFNVITNSENIQNKLKIKNDST